MGQVDPQEGNTKKKSREETVKLAWPLENEMLLKLFQSFSNTQRKVRPDKNLDRISNDTLIQAPSTAGDTSVIYYWHSLRW